MVKNLKNTFIYFYIYKFRKKLSLLFGIILFNIVFSFFISDMVSMIDNKILLFTIKWGIYFLSIIFVFYIFKPKLEKLKKQKYNLFTNNEKKILEKDNLKNRADLIIEKYKKRG